MGVWEQLKGEFATATGNDLERLTLPLGRLFWPNLVRTPRLRDFDRAGVDLAAVAGDGTLSVVVQCKGFFADRRLDETHYKQIEESLDKFVASSLKCEEFVLFHNQTGENGEITRKIQAQLRHLVVLGKAKTTRLWDRQTIVRDAKYRLDKMVIERLREETSTLLEQVTSVFRFGGVHVSDVPFSEHRLILLRHEPPKIEPVNRRSTGAMAELIVGRTDKRWTLLTGVFGSGKSTSALHAALDSNEIVAFVRCADIEFEHGFGGTNSLLRRVTQALHLFDDYDDEDRKALEIYSGPTLRIALSRQNSGAVLILDGLDENRTFSDSVGLTHLVNALAELRCSIVLTTRQEHFDSTYGNFEQVLDELARTRDARLFKLEEWTRPQTIQFLTAAAASTIGAEQTRLVELTSKLQSGEPLKWPEELLGHPLFLQMIAELTAEGETPSATIGGVLSSWIPQKIMRDLRVPRALPMVIHNRAAFADQMMTLMENVAAAMTEKTEEGLELREAIESSEVVKVAEATLGIRGIDIATLSGVSLLLPITQRRKANVPMRFSHRIFQEYFTARHAVREKMTPDAVPAAIAKLMFDLK
ncbi:MAG: hypothetical protein Q8K93_02280 [Reyranella sp.]|nr:hypothetical protein [Reyranella sp.]